MSARIKEMVRVATARLGGEQAGGGGASSLGFGRRDSTVRLGGGGTSLRRQPQPMAPTVRTVYCNDRENNAPVGYKGNSVSTTKYSILTFLPKGLFEQGLEHPVYSEKMVSKSGAAGLQRGNLVHDRQMGSGDVACSHWVWQLVTQMQMMRRNFSWCTAWMVRLPLRFYLLVFLHLVSKVAVDSAWMCLGSTMTQNFYCMVNIT